MNFQRGQTKTNIFCATEAMLSLTAFTIDLVVSTIFWAVLITDFTAEVAASFTEQNTLQTESQTPVATALMESRNQFQLLLVEVVAW